MGGVSRIEGNVELDGENAEVIVDEAELKGKIQIGKGAKLKVQPSTRDRCRKKKCPVKFGGPKENDEEEDDTTATKANKIKARSLLRDVVGKTKKEKDAIQLTVDLVKTRLVEEGGVPDADDEAINTPEKVWDFAAKIDEARKKTRAFLARCEEATNNADGGGRRRLSELKITHDKVEAALQKEGLTMAGSECDVDSVKTKRYCATKTAAE